MKCQPTEIAGIPALIWGERSDRVFIHVHGKQSRKEYAADFARMAQQRGWQTLSFDLPEHGERVGGPERCDLGQGVQDLNAVADTAFARWGRVGLFACSLGAWFSLNAYQERALACCLFQSPVVNMQWLVRRMMQWSGVTEERLAREREVDTPIDRLRWEEYQYIMAHPVQVWPHETAILYAGKDVLQPREAMEAFAARFGAQLTVSPESEHPFMAESDGPIVARWLTQQLAQMDK